MAHLALDQPTRTHEVDRRLDADRAVSGLIIRAGIPDVNRIMRQQRLNGRITRVWLSGELRAEILEQQRRQTGHRGGGHGRAASGGIAEDPEPRVAGGHSEIPRSLTAGRHDVGLESSVIGRPPAGKISHRIIVGIDGAYGDVVLGAGRRCEGVVSVDVLGRAVRTAPFVARGEDHTKRRPHTAPNDRIDQRRGHAVVAGQRAGQAIGTDVGSNGIVGDVGAVGNGVQIVGLKIAGIVIQKRSGARALESVGRHQDTRRHPPIQARALCAVATYRAGHMRRMGVKR